MQVTAELQVPFAWHWTVSSSPGMNSSSHTNVPVAPYVVSPRLDRRTSPWAVIGGLPQSIITDQGNAFTNVFYKICLEPRK